MPHVRNHTTMWRKLVEVRMPCRMSNSDVVQISLKRTWNLLARKFGTCIKMYKVKGTYVMACEQFFRSPNRILDVRVSAEEESVDLPCSAKGPRDQAHAGQLAATMFLHSFDYIRIVKFARLQEPPGSWRRTHHPANVL